MRFVPPRLTEEHKRFLQEVAELQKWAMDRILKSMDMTEHLKKRG